MKQVFEVVLGFLQIVCFLMESAQRIFEPESVEKHLFVFFKISTGELEIAFLLLAFYKHHVDFHQVLRLQRFLFLISVLVVNSQDRLDCGETVVVVSSHVTGCCVSNPVLSYCWVFNQLESSCLCKSFVVTQMNLDLTEIA